MKRLLKTTYRKLFQPAGSRHRSHQSLGLPVSSGICASTLALATLVNAVWTKPAAAISFTSIDWSQQNWDRVTNLGPGTVETQTFDSNGVRVRFDISVTGGSIEEIDESDQVTFGLEGGFGREDTNLSIRFDPTNRGDTANINVTFLDPNTNQPIQVEGARFILLDIDRDDGDQWQDEVTVTGDSTPELVPATNPPIAFDTQIGGGSGFSTSPTTPAASYTVSIAGNTATGLYAPDANPADPPNLPVPAINEAENESAQGNFVAEFSDPVSSVQISYQDGSFAPAQPVAHSIGLFNVIVFPGIIGTSKEARAVNGRTVTYAVRVDNLGAQVPLNNVQLTENLDGTFGAGNYTVSNVRSEPAAGSQVALTPNAGFTGTGANTGILAGTDTLQPGEFGVILFDVAVDAAAGNGPFNNQVEATGTTPSGALVQDESLDVTGAGNNTPDPNGDGIPNEQSPTPVTLTNVAVNNPAIAVSEQVIGTPVVNPTTGPAATYAGNTSRVTYRIRVQNIGDELLDQVQLVNDFTDTFDTDDNGYEIVAVRQVTGGGQTPNALNPAYDGGDPVNDNTNLGNTPTTGDSVLITNGVLDVGEFSEYEIDVDVNTAGNGATLIRPLSDPDPYINFTTATGRGQAAANPSNRLVRDVSNDGTGFPSLADALDPPTDPVNGGSVVADPGTPGTLPAGPTPGTPENIQTPVRLLQNPQIGVSERVFSTTLSPAGGTFGTNGNRTARVVYRIVARNIGPEPLDRVELTNSFLTTYGVQGIGATDDFAVVDRQLVTGVGGVTTVPVNPNFDGGTDQRLAGDPADDASALGLNEFVVYDVTVDVNLDGNTVNPALPGPFDNQTRADGVGETSRLDTTDLSNDINPLTAPGVTDPLDIDDALLAIDPNNNGNPGETTGGLQENVVTPVNLVQTPQIGVSERVLSTELSPTGGTFGPNGNRTARVVYRIVARNIGPEPLDRVELLNDFRPTYGTAGTAGTSDFTIINRELVTGVGGVTTVPVNPNFDGSGDLRLAGDPTDDASALGLNEFVVYDVTVDVNLDGANVNPNLPGPFDNQTQANGVGEGSRTDTTDLSNDINPLTAPGVTDPLGIDDALLAIDPNNNGNPGETTGGLQENVQTPVSFATAPEISVIERIDPNRTVLGAGVTGTPATFGGNNARLVYQIVVRNIGPEDLDEVQLTNDFRPTFGVSGNGGTDDFLIVDRQLVTPPATGNLPVNPVFDGSGDTRLSGGTGDPTNTLPIGEFAVYEVTVDVNTAGNTVQPQLPGPFNNQTTAEGLGITSNLPTDDLSNDINPFPNGGTVPDPVASDPNSNAEANEPAENIVTPAVLGSDLRIVKRITQVTRGTTVLFANETGQFNDQAGDNNDNLLFNRSAGALPLGIVDTPTALESGDVVEYTAYFFNAGVATAENIQLCDVIRIPSILNAGTSELAGPNPLPNLALFGPSALLSEEAPLAPLAPFCEDIAGTGNFPSGSIPESGGGVVLDGSGGNLNLAPDEIAAFRFSIRVP